MVIYEVNLKIISPVFDDYITWLTPHVHEVLSFNGFKRARYLVENPNQEDGLTKLTVQYEVDTLENLQHYLDNYAKHMRDDGLKNFPEQFSVIRRIFVVEQEFNG